MAISEVYGLDRFAEYLRGLEDCYTVIGGTACDIILSEAIELLHRVYGL